jgi:flagellar hook-associated protein 2
MMAETGTNLISSINKSGSGVDLANLVDGLVKAETDSNQSSITKKVDATNLQISSFGQLTTKLSNFSSTLTSIETSNSRSVSSTGTAATLSVTNEGLSQDVNANISVSSIARGQVVSFDLTHSSLLNSNTLSTASSIPQGTLTLTLSGVDTNIVIDSSSNTVQSLINKINAITGIQASVVDTTGAGGLSMVIKSESGTANTFSLSSSDGLSAFSTSGMSSSSSPINLSVAATDAVFKVDGLEVTRSSNSVTDLFSGYTLDINSISSSEFTIKSSVSSTNARDRMQEFVNGLNEVKNYLIRETKRGLDGEDDGALVGDTAASQILRNLSSITTQEIVGYSANSYYLANLGVETERDGSISLNKDKFDAAIAADTDLVNIIFSSQYTSTSDILKLSGSESAPPKPGSYNFDYTSGGDAVLNGETISPILNSSNNKVFSATSGDAKNMSVEMLSDVNTSATVRYGQSLIDKLQAYVKDITANSGIINKRTSALNENLLGYGDEQAELDDRITSLTAAYNEKFGAMESLVTQLNKTGEYLTSLMDAWNKKE